MSVTVSALLVAGCGGSSKSSGKAPPNVTNGVVSMTLDGPVSSYDPTQASTFQDAVALAALYDTLVNFDPSGKLIPGLADKWSSTKKTATFHLKNGVTCSDGTSLTGAMVAASLNRLFDPATKAPLIGQAIGPGNTAKATSSGDSVTITTGKPWSDLVPGMTGPYAGIVCPAGTKDPSSLRTKSAGTGAFVSESQVTGSSYTMARRAKHTWGPAYADQAAGEPPKKLVLKVVDDENTRANLTSTGELQVASFTSNVWERFKSTAGISAQASPQSDTMLVFNETAGHATSQQNVRLAISQALDRSVLNKVQSFGAGQLISSLGRSTYECFDGGSAAQIPKYDAAAAAKVLKGVKLQVIGTNILAGGAANDQIMSALQAAGAAATVHTMDNQAWVSDLFSGKNDWDVTIFVYGNRLSSFLPVGQFFVHGAPPKGLNLGATNNPAAEQAFDAATASSAKEKCAALTTFQQSLLRNNDVLPLATAPVHVLFAGGISGSVLNGFAVPASIRVGKASG
ncbi:ABC transporter substrate-binding protein [Actinoallomurus iriomotensis]|nr:ABC transporter substrate-binding protein [Actinoallomurus iriomotensis]